MLNQEETEGQEQTAPSEISQSFIPTLHAPNANPNYAKLSRPNPSMAGRRS